MDTVAFIYEPVALTIGNFDGLHKGHRLLIETIKKTAVSLGLKSAVMSFRPPPAHFYGANTPLITSFSEKEKLLSSLGVDYYMPLTFDESLAKLTPCQFFEYLGNKLKLSALAVGEGFRFGYKKAGDVALLEEYCAKKNITFCSIPRLAIDRVSISSSLIREFVLKGDVANVPPLLGRTFSICGTVEIGEQLGRKLGFPTANISIDCEEYERLLPKTGVYKGLATLRGERYSAMIYVGNRPTITNRGEKRLEAYIINFSGDIYGEMLTLNFERFLRDEKRFETLDALKEQLKIDLENSKES